MQRPYYVQKKSLAFLDSEGMCFVLTFTKCSKSSSGVILWTSKQLLYILIQRRMPFFLTSTKCSKDVVWMSKRLLARYTDDSRTVTFKRKSYFAWMIGQSTLNINKGSRYWERVIKGPHITEFDILSVRDIESHMFSHCVFLLSRALCKSIKNYFNVRFRNVWQHLWLLHVYFDTSRRKKYLNCFFIFFHNLLKFG